VDSEEESDRHPEWILLMELSPTEVVLVSIGLIAMLIMLGIIAR
jgi:hypothetical protein